MPIFDKLRPLGLLILRLAVALIFFYHGYQKLFGAPASALRAFPKMGFPSYFAYIAGSLEMFGAILLILGLFTRVISLLLAIEMGVAIARVHLPQGGIYAVGNYELPLSLAAACLALATVGAGMISLDAATFERSGKSPRPRKS